MPSWGDGRAHALQTPFDHNQSSCFTAATRMYPLMWLSGAFLAGILLSTWARLPWPAWAALSAASLLTSAFERRFTARFPDFAARLRLCPLPVMLVAACLLAGAARGQASRTTLTPKDAGWYVGRGEVSLRGWVSAPPQPDQPTPVFRVTVQELTLEGESAPMQVRGVVQVRTRSGAALEYGDRVTLRGNLTTPPGLEDFSYREYLARQNVHALLQAPTGLAVEGREPGLGLRRALQRVRVRIYRNFNAALPQPEAALVNGILLGLDGDLPPALVEDFQTSGTAHIIAISGFNIALLIVLLMRLAGACLQRWAALAATLLAIFAYTLLVGAEPSVVRAAIMGSLALVGQELGRRSSAANALVFAAALMSLFNPNLPWDASFQLSFMATLGLVLFATPLERAFQRLAGRWLNSAQVKRWSAPVSEYLLVTLAAQITTLPVLAAHFGRISWVALLANPLILPAQPLLMILSGLAALAGLIWQPLGAALAMLAWPLAAYTTRLASWFGSIRGAALEIAPHQVAWLWLLLALILALRWKTIRAALRRQARPAALLLVTGLAAALALAQAARLPDGNLRMVMMDVEDQPVALLTLPQGESVLIGAAPPDALEAALGRWLPPFDRRLDSWILPSGQNAQTVTALLDHTNIAAVAASAPFWQTGAGRDAEDALALAGSRYLYLQPGVAWRSASGARVEVLAVKGGDAALLVEWGRFRALLPGELVLEDLAGSLTRLQAVSVLVLDARNGNGWEQLAPRSVLWLGEGAPPTLPGLAQIPPDGWVAVRSDGKRMWIETGRLR